MTAFLRLLGAEMRRELRHTQTYALEFIGDQVLFIAGFFLLSGLFQILAGGEYTSPQLLISLVGFLTWRVADGCILRTVNNVVMESQWGTLEQLWLAPVSPLWLLAVRSLVTLIAYCLRVALMGTILLLLLGLDLDLRMLPILLVLFLVSQVSAFGIAYLLVGLQLVYKSVASLTLAISTALLFVTGALVPLDHAPWLAWLAQILPLGPGIRLLQEFLRQPHLFPQMLISWQGVWLVCHALLYLGLGLLALRQGEERARLLGQLAQY